ncbi:YciI family protein [Niveispirillum irakense]|uniref:YciI family protein n=1 Tax=Niveispirillum irakense TaxID=34011 RepID=UPI00041F684A|nr:YciI family protein [Niveispirillum irakense]
MHFILECHDKAGALDLRMATRPPHLEYLTGLGDKITIAGPILGEDGKPVGSLLILDVADLAEAESIAANDPYAKAGLFQTVTLRPYRKVLPA